jgi:GTP-binding protein LepA
MVYAGLFPVDTNDFEHLRDALDKLLLNDSSVTCQRTSSSALGLGFRLGFLGVLHMDVFRQRLEEEYDADIILTNPAVPYKLNYEDESVIIENPSDYNPHDAKLMSVEEPFVMSRMMVPKDYLGNVMSLCDKRRGTLVDTEFISEMRVVLKYELPLAEVAENGFFNELKQVTSGYASLDYEDPVFKESKISKLDVFINREPVDALSYLTHASEAQDRAGSLARSLKSLIRRQQFEIAIQVQANGKVMARETIQAYRKDVTAKLYGGDQTRKRKLLDKQKEGKKRMKMIGKVELDKEVFLNINKR